MERSRQRYAPRGRHGLISRVDAATARALARAKLLKTAAARYPVRYTWAAEIGFHVHAVGKCEGPGFPTAGPHLDATGVKHPDHAGDMPPLLVTPGGKAEARFVTDRFSIADLRDADAAL